MRAVGHVVLALAVVAAAGAGGVDGVAPAAALMPLASDIKEISPSRDDVVGIAHPIIVTFNRAITNRSAAEQAIKVTTTPAMTGKFEWLERNVVQWVPDEYWPAHSTVTLSLGSRTTQFKTGAAVVGVADISDHTFTVTIDGIGPGSSIAMPAPHHLPHLGEEGVLLASMGRPQYPTPVGKYSVLSKERTVRMDSSSVGIPVTADDGYLLDVDYGVRFTRRGLFVHSAPWAVPVIGFENVSHGCVSLIPAAAEWYFDTVNIGDPIIVQE